MLSHGLGDRACQIASTGLEQWTRHQPDFIQQGRRMRRIIVDTASGQSLLFIRVARCQTPLPLGDAGLA